MASKTIGFGVALIVLGLAGFAASGCVAATALIPAYFGVMLVLSGMLARSERRRKAAMHIAVVVGLAGFLGSLYSLVRRASDGTATAASAQALMVVLTGIFVALCVKSFIDARRPKA